MRNCQNLFHHVRRLLVCAIVGVGLAVVEVNAADKATDDFNVGVSLYRSQRFETAADTFGSFLKDFPEHPRANTARLYYALSLSSLEKYGPAREMFGSYLKAEPDGDSSADARYRLAECSYYLRDYSDAIGQFQQYLSKHPGHSLNDWAKLFLGDSFVATRQYDKSLEQLVPLLNSNAADGIKLDARMSCGRAYEGLQRSDDALREYSEVVKSNDGSVVARALNRIGAIQYAAGKYRESAAAWDQLLEKQPGASLAASANLGAGMSRFKLGEYEPALARLRAVPRDSSGAAQAVMMSALALKELGRVEESRREFAEALKAAGDSPLAVEILMQQAQLERNASAPLAAAQIYEDIADRWPTGQDTAECLFNATELRLEAGERERAEQLWMRLDKEFPEAAGRTAEQVLRGRIYLDRNEPDKAITILSKAVSGAAAGASRAAVVGQYYLVRALYESGKHDQVVEQATTLQTALQNVQQSGAFASSAPDAVDKLAAEVHGALALATMSSLERKQFADVLKFGDEFLAKAVASKQKLDVTAARAIALCNLNRPAEAVPILKALSTESPDDKQTWSAVLQCADSALQSKALPEAEALFSLALAVKSSPAIREAGQLGLAWSLFEARKFAPSQAAFQAFIDEFGQSEDGAQARYMFARCVEEQGDATNTVAAWQSVFTALTMNAPPASAGAESEGSLRYAFDAGRQAARGLAKLQKFDDADKAWAQLDRQFPNAKDADKVLEEWAWMHSNEGRFEQADQIHRQLLSRFPESAFAGQSRLALAESQLDAGELDKAALEFDAIVAEERYGATEKERALYHLIELHVAARRWEPALLASDKFLSAFNSGPLSAQVRMFAGDANLQNGSPDRATTLLEALRTEITSGTVPIADWTDRVWVLLADAALRQQQYDRITELERELRERSPSSAFWFQMNEVQGRRWKQQAPPDFAKARDYFERVTADPAAQGTETAARCQFQIAESLMLQSELVKAIPEYFKVYQIYQIEELRAQALFQAASCEARLQRKEAAIRDFKEVIEKFPSSNYATAAQQELATLQGP